MDKTISDYGLPKDGFISEKQESSYVKNIERIFRASKEYKQFINMVRQEYDGEYCRVTNEHCSDVEVELHHYPLTLYEICFIATYTLLDRSKDIVTTFDVAKLVCDMHFKLHVGVVPIIKTAHEKIHSSGLLLPKEWIIGDPWYLISNQTDYILPEEVLVWKLRKASEFTLEDWQKHVKPVLWPDTRS